MAIPTITFPEFPLLTSFLGDLLHKVPFEIPTLLHPPLVHFAIALPIIIVILEVFNVFAKLTSTPENPKGKTVSALSLFMIVILFFVALGAYATGVTDGTNAWDTLSAEAQSEVKAHKLLGAYVVLSAFILLVFKFLSLIGTKSKVFFLLLTIAFAGLSLNQGKEGGELVFKDGVNIEKVADITSDLEDAKDELSEAEEAQSTLSDSSESLVKEKKELNEKVTQLNLEKTALTEEKAKLEESIEKLKSDSSKELEEIKAKAKIAIDEAKVNAKSMIETMKEKATETLNKAKDMANDAKESLSEELTPAPVAEDIKVEEPTTEEVVVEGNATKAE